MLDDSERIRHVLQDFRPVLDEISTVCNMSFQEDRLEQSEQLVHEMQRPILEQLEHFLQAAQVSSFSVRLCHNLMLRVETTLAVTSQKESHICILGSGGHRRRVEDHREQCHRASGCVLRFKCSQPTGD